MFTQRNNIEWGRSFCCAQPGTRLTYRPPTYKIKTNKKHENVTMLLMCWKKYFAVHNLLTALFRVKYLDASSLVRKLKAIWE